ncbi:MAG TPA: hypothetical protein VIN06_05200 [Devosia sp.]
MKITLAATLVSALALFSPITPLTALPANAAQCDEHTPEAMKRPGGFCEQVKNLDSLARGMGSDCDWIEQTSLPGDFLARGKGARVHVAATYKCLTKEEQNSI